VFSFFLTSWCRTIQFLAGFSGLGVPKTLEIIGDLSIAPMTEIVKIDWRTIDNSEWQSVCFAKRFDCQR